MLKRMNVFLLFWLTLILLIVNKISAQELNLAPIVVTASGFTIPQSKVGRTVEVLTREDIKALPVNSVNELLEYLSSVDVRTRGIAGMQTDFSIRGSNFEEVLILVNGMRINDPQTGHHLGDIPISLSEIERIEVVPGGSSGLYGHGGFGGVINIITKKRHKPGIKAQLAHGEYDYNLEGLNLYSPSFKNMQIGLGWQRQLSNGYRPDTDFDDKLGNLNINGQGWQLLAGIEDKKFGANSFYTTYYPWQWEHTQTQLISAQKELSFGKTSFNPAFLYRRHNDYFVLDRSHPAFYQNHHRTHVYALKLPFKWQAPSINVASGLELGREEIKSSCLDNHFRWHEGLFLGLNPHFKRINTNLDLRVDHYSEDLGTQFSYNLATAYWVSKSIKLRAATGRSFRIPSYTELYYDSPANHGNPHLNPEHAWHLEGGMDILGSNWLVGWTIFNRWGRQIIDWIKEGDAYYAQNISQVNTFGNTVYLNLFGPRYTLKIGYTFLNQTYHGSGKAKYAGGYLKHKADLILTSHLPWQINTTLALSYQKRMGQTAYLLLDAKLEKQLKSQYGNYSLFLEGKNLLDASYEDISGVPMPGAWVWGGVKIGL